MDHRSLGASGLRVSELCLGTMSFGWVTDEPTSRRILDRYVEEGGNFIDTADIYADGASEEIIGRWLVERGREDLVVATKVRFATGPGAHERGLSKQHILEAVEASLRRLNTDHIDLYQLHCWDAETPLEETLEAMDSLIQQGKIRYVGISNFTGWQLQKAADFCRFLGFERVVSLQALYNLLDRFLEWDLLPVCRAEGLGLLCWSPLAGGWLTGMVRPGMREPPVAGRFREAEEGGWSESWSNYDTEHTWRVLGEFLSIADEVGQSPVQVAVNWLRTRPGVTAPVLGAESVVQLEDSLGALTWNLTPDQINRLNRVSDQPAPRYPHRFINRFNPS